MLKSNEIFLQSNYHYLRIKDRYLVNYRNMKVIFEISLFTLPQRNFYYTPQPAKNKQNQQLKKSITLCNLIYALWRWQYNQSKALSFEIEITIWKENSDLFHLTLAFSEKIIQILKREKEILNDKRRTFFPFLQTTS